MDVLFYHLQQAPLERVLPDLLQKSLQKGWRAMVEVDPPERIEALDALLWTFSDEGFLPHGVGNGPRAAEQPVLICNDVDNVNGADIRFFVDGGDVTAHQGYQRLVYLFHGHDEAAVARARQQWKAARDAEMDVTYWLQNAAGAWEKRA